MYDVIIISSATSEHVVALSGTDRRVLRVLANGLIGETLETVQSVFMSSHRTRVRTFARSNLIRAVGRLVELAKEDERLP
jgi:hypothetical protein